MRVIFGVLGVITPTLGVDVHPYHRDMMPDVSLVYNTHPGHSGSAFAHFLLSSDDVKSYDIILEPPNPCQHTLVCGVLCGDLCRGPF